MELVIRFIYVFMYIYLFDSYYFIIDSFHFCVNVNVDVAICRGGGFWKRKGAFLFLELQTKLLWCILCILSYESTLFYEKRKGRIIAFFLVLFSPNKSRFVVLVDGFIDLIAFVFNLRTQYQRLKIQQNIVGGLIKRPIT